MRACDFAARLHGDEFAVLLADLPDEGATGIDAVTARLHHALRLTLDAGELVVTASIGVVRSREIGRDADGYVREADAAMYRTKLRGGDCITIAGDESRPCGDGFRDPVWTSERFTQRGSVSPGILAGQPSARQS